ncbi:sialate O-acetylesterase [Muricauda brasiliensis]|uniref:sialate O-acetylesterase n=1 Tax=Muricauda brasiliensis TaxID=2162892 RepID=UPI001900A4E3|nr:sialate O-acetylesterase [Muricauda brasiliensis]
MKSSKVLVALIVFICSVTMGISQITLPKIITDGMVLQRDANIMIWGWASPNEQVVATFNGKKRKATANAHGDWSVEFPKMKAGGPYTMKISGKNEILLEDILIGDVWLCSGQSNMVHQMDIHDVTYAEDIANADFPEIRHFKVPRKTDLTGPSKHLDGGSWEVAVSEEVRPFSAVAYFFARKLYKKYGVPIGLVNASVGGTPIEAWINEEGYQKFPEKLKIIEENKDTAFVNSHSMNRFSGNQQSQKPEDKGLIGETPWYDVSFEPKNWRRINIPGYWEDQGVRDLNGVVWYRKEIDLPTSMDAAEATVFLGRIVDADELYINGEKVGNTTYQYPQRRYDVPANLLKAGKNTFVIRVTNNNGKGGFVPDKPYYIFTDRDTVDLKGYWKYKVGEVYPPMDFSSFTHNNDAPEERIINPQNEPTALYNGMVAPYTQLPIKGVLWYQGESNAGRPEEYLDLMHALINGWRGIYGDPELPFIYAQLPNFGDVTYSPTDSNWAELREAQLRTWDDAYTAMTVNIDLGEWNDIHPDNKKDVGERMALAAQKIAYEEDIVYSGPLYQSSKVENDKIIISFSHIGGGLTTDDGEALDSFEIAGEDKNFVWAKAKIDGDKVIVWNDEVPNPKYVRYAWADNPDNPNLYNTEGLPASPFRTK